VWEQGISQVGTRLRGFGTSVFTGTRELLEQVTDAISAELDSIEGLAARNRPAGHSHSSASRCAPHPTVPACPGRAAATAAWLPVYCTR
jgi:hypothetical protein